MLTGDHCDRGAGLSGFPQDRELLIQGTDAAGATLGAVLVNITLGEVSIWALSGRVHRCRFRTGSSLQTNLQASL